MQRTAYAGDVTALHPLTSRQREQHVLAGVLVLTSMSGASHNCMDACCMAHVHGPAHQHACCCLRCWIMSLSMLHAVGCGPNVLLIDLLHPSAAGTGIVSTWQVLEGDRVHGIASAPVPHSSFQAHGTCHSDHAPPHSMDKSTDVVVVHGGLQLHVWLLESQRCSSSLAARKCSDGEAAPSSNGSSTCNTSSSSGSGSSSSSSSSKSAHTLTHQLDLGQRHAWVMQAVLSQPHVQHAAKQQSTAVHYTLAVGYINNAVEVWELTLSRQLVGGVTGTAGGVTARNPAGMHVAVTWSARRLAVVESTVRCLLYSQALLLKPASRARQEEQLHTSELWVASGRHQIRTYTPTHYL